MRNRNNILSVDTIVDLGKLFDIAVHSPEEEGRDERRKEITTAVGKTKERWPIVVVMGHVDHGKTTLLDYLRKMNTAAKEKGGITQHLSAYEVPSSHGNITFLDTPGHEAFSYMRKRGARITDIAVLVVAIDDGVKPQTIEALKHAKQAEVPIIVAINKIDKISSPAALETIKRQLAEHDLLPEDWGGETICVPISAKTGQGVEELLEMIVLQSHMMEIKARVDVPAKAFVLETQLERGFGPVATVIPLEGTLKQGDFFICGAARGKVRLLIDSAGKRIKQSGPSVPVQVVGFDSFTHLGDWLEVVGAKEYAKAKGAVPSRARAEGVPAFAPSLEKQKVIKLIVKTDTYGSLQAVQDSIKKLSKHYHDVPAALQIIRSGVGDISESDVSFAIGVEALVIGLHVKTEKNAIALAKEKAIKIDTYQIIYRMIETLEELLEKSRIVEKKWKKIGEAVVRKVFDIKGQGVIAGCYINQGIFSRHCKVVCVRNGEKVGEGFIASLQRERKVVKEVHSGHECGFITKEFQGWQVEDVVEAYIEE